MSATAGGAGIYQVRLNRIQHPSWLVTELARSVWTQAKSIHEKLPPVALPMLYQDFLAAFKRRMFLYPGCGYPATCRQNMRPALWDEPRSGTYFWGRRSAQYIPQSNYTLELARGLPSFVDGLAALAGRRLKRHLPEADRKTFRARIAPSIRRVLAPFVFHSDVCTYCRIRLQPRQSLFGSSASAALR